MRSFSVYMVCTLFVLLATSAAVAQDGSIGGDGGAQQGDQNEVPPDLPAGSVESEVVVVIPGGEHSGVGVVVTDPVGFGAVVPAGRGFAGAPAIEAPCRELPVIVVVGDDGLSQVVGGGGCGEYAVCVGERIDDHYFGQISGATGLTGLYGAFLTEILGGTAAGGGGVVDISPSDLSTSVLAPLGSQPSMYSIASFSACRYADGLFERTDTNWLPRLFWDTTIDTEYDPDRLVGDLYARLVARLDAYEPEIATAPPLDTGHTWVRFPTWFWIDEPLITVTVQRSQDLDLINIELAADLLRVRYRWGPDAVTCTPDQLVPYLDGDDPLADVGHCHLIADAPGERALTIELHYRVRERISTRNHTSHPWTHGPWTLHPDSPLITNHDAVAFDVHELYSLNTPSG